MKKLSLGDIKKIVYEGLGLKEDDKGPNTPRNIIQAFDKYNIGDFWEIDFYEVNEDIVLGLYEDFVLLDADYEKWIARDFLRSRLEPFSFEEGEIYKVNDAFFELILSIGKHIKEEEDRLQRIKENIKKEEQEGAKKTI